MTSRRKISVVTGSRAEYGLLKSLLEEIENSETFELNLIVTGSHLSKNFGETYKEIESDGFEINHKILILDDDTSKLGVSNAIAKSLKQFPEVLQEINPDYLVLLGDRFEIFSAALSALICNLKIAHIHGGETSEGAYDEALRHSITKMSHLHFTSTDQHKNRVIQLGERPESVFNVGALGVEAIKKIKLLSKQEIEKSIGIRLKKSNLLVTFHPETLETKMTPAEQVGNLLNVLGDLDDETTIIFTRSNADVGGLEINEEIEKFVSNKSNAVLHSSLGQQKYLSLLSLVDGMIGNSSSALIEAPSLNIAAINIGDRQKGRTRSKNIIDCQNNQNAIKKALKKLYNKEFQKKIKLSNNPYDGGKTSKKIIDILKRNLTKNALKKTFYDMQ